MTTSRLPDPIAAIAAPGQSIPAAHRNHPVTGEPIRLKSTK